MRSFRAIGYLFLLASLSYRAFAGTIGGEVKGPDGAPFKGAFVRAQKEGSNITVNVLSDRIGRYRIQNLVPGTYRIWVTAAGYKGDAGKEIKVDEARPVSSDFLLQKGTVQWTDLSIYQGRILLPEDDPGKHLFFLDCQTCHGYMYMVRILGLHSDEEAWRAAVRFMRDVPNGVGDLRATEEEAGLIAAYAGRTFGAHSKLPPPAELPAYEKVKMKFSDEAMKIAYVEYELPPHRFAWNANPDKQGNIWMPFAKTGNGIGKLDPKTGEVQTWDLPPNKMHMLDSHSAAPAPDGMVWYIEVKGCKLGKLDPKTGKFTEYLPPNCKEGELGSGGVTVRVDRLGYVWSGEACLYRFDPKTEQFKTFPEAGRPYGVELDTKDNVWFASWNEGKVGKVNINTLKLSIYTPPTTTRLASLNKNFPSDGKYGYFLPGSHPKTAGTKRIQIDPNGVAWFGEWYGGDDAFHSQIGSVDPRTGTIKEYPLPGPAATPYAVAVDRNGYVWYNSSDEDVLGRLDPKTGTVVEYPFPHSDNGVRELLPDAEGRIWYTSGYNDRVGYFFFHRIEAMASVR